MAIDYSGFTEAEIRWIDALGKDGADTASSGDDDAGRDDRTDDSADTAAFFTTIYLSITGMLAYLCVFVARICVALSFTGPIARGLRVAVLGSRHERRRAHRAALRRTGADVINMAIDGDAELDISDVATARHAARSVSARAIVDKYRRTHPLPKPTEANRVVVYRQLASIAAEFKDIRETDLHHVVQTATYLAFVPQRTEEYGEEFMRRPDVRARFESHYKRAGMSWVERLKARWANEAPHVTFAAE
jgi:hypothetical protein